MNNDIILNLIKKYDIKNIMIIDELSYLNKSSDKFMINGLCNEIYKNNNIVIYVISNNIYKDIINININPTKIYEVQNFFKKNSNFDSIIDLNSKDTITQLSIFSLFENKTNICYVIKIENKKESNKLIYYIQKFTKNITIYDKYLIIKK